MTPAPTLPPFRSARPRSQAAPPRATLAFCYLHGAKRTSATCSRGGRGWGRLALPSSSSAPAWGLQRHLCETRPRPSPACSCCCLCLLATRVDRSPTITEARLHFPGGSRRPVLPSSQPLPDKLTLQGPAQRLPLGRPL